MSNTEQDFEIWFDIMESKCRSLGYDGPIDKHSFEWDHQEGKTPEEAAEAFVKEMQE